MHLEGEGGLDEVLGGQVQVVQLVHVPQEHLLAVGTAIAPVAAAAVALSAALVEVEQVHDAGHLLVAALAGLQVWETLKQVASSDEKQMFP